MIACYAYRFEEEDGFPHTNHFPHIALLYRDVTGAWRFTGNTISVNYPTLPHIRRYFDLYIQNLQSLMDQHFLELSRDSNNKRFVQELPQTHHMKAKIELLRPCIDVLLTTYSGPWEDPSLQHSLQKYQFDAVPIPLLRLSQLLADLPRPPAPRFSLEGVTYGAVEWQQGPFTVYYGAWPAAPAAFNIITLRSRQGNEFEVGLIGKNEARDVQGIQQSVRLHLYRLDAYLFLLNQSNVGGYHDEAIQILQQRIASLQVAWERW